MKETTRKRISNRQMIWIVGVLVLVLAIGGSWWWFRASRYVSTDDARIKGTIVAVSAKVNGRIEKVLVQEGEVVQPGQVIVQLEKQEFEAQVEQAQANLAIAKARLAELTAGNRPQEVAQSNALVLQARANMENARRNSDRDELLAASGAISQQQRDASRTAYEIAAAQMESAREQHSMSSEGFRKEAVMMAAAQVKQAEAALKNAEIQLADTEVKAPVSGTVALKSVENGEVVAFGQQVFSISNLSDVWVGANIEETQIGRIKIGQLVEFTIDAYADHYFHGHVSEVGPAAGSQFALLPTENSSANFTKVTQRLPIKIKVDDSDVVLKPGMSAIITISTR